LTISNIPTACGRRARPAWSGTAETLDQYLERPRDFIKGNRMSFRGMADPEDRQALIMA
jgi:cytochrome c2